MLIYMPADCGTGTRRLVLNNCTCTSLWQHLWKFA